MLEGLAAGWKPLSISHSWATALVLGLLLFQCKGSENNFKCGVGLDSPGATIPKGDIVIEYGNSLEIFCNLDLNHKDAQGYNASNLVFYRDTERVPSEFIEVLNTTTIRLFQERPSASKAYYYCKLRRTPLSDIGVCLNTVAVGFRPQEVLNFTCISHNWSNLTCRWTKPDNAIKTKYALHFHLPGRAGARMTFTCPPLKEDNFLKRTLKKNEDLCFWDHTTSPPYRQPYEYYYFVMTGENQLYLETFSLIKFHHYSHVIPSPADKLKVIGRSTGSIELKWDVPFPMSNFPPGVVHRIEYQASWDDRSTWHIANTSELGMHRGSYVYNLTGLKYANTFYDIRVYMRSSVAVGEDKWSLPALLTVKTEPTIPGAAPLTDVGSFEVTGGITRDVYVYWQFIPDYLHNGEDFEYKIFVKENGYDRPHMVPSEVKKAYAKFRAISHNSYTFTIVAANVHGYSKEKAVVYVPSRKDIPPEPVSFTKIAFGPDLYELSWKPPPGSQGLIENYTIFWCDNERDRPYQCSGFLNWTHVPNDVFVKNISVAANKIHQFAISANGKNASSGMIWASCTVLHNKVPGKMKSVWINRIGSTFIEVGWKLECSDRIGIVSAFRVYFCPIVGPTNLTCKEPQQSTRLDVEPGQIHGNVTGLRPYTTYMLSVSIMIGSREGLQSDPLFNTTLEAAPDAPRNVTVAIVTNSSVVVEWLRPASLNGHLRFYRVHYNDSVHQVENISMNNMKMKVKLENLTSYMTYRVGVEACTTECSKSSEVIVKTEVGNPGKMERPHVRFINSSLVLVSWKPPLVPGGYLNYYQVVIQQSEIQNKSTFYYTSVGNESQIPIPDCKTDGPDRKYTFMVRAVNVDHLNHTYYGDWSDPGETSCYNSGPSKSVMTAIWVFGFLIISALCLVFVYAAKRLWLRCKEMKNLEVKLPPGLDPANRKDKDQDFNLDISWPTDIHDHHMSGTCSSSSADEELLLQKKEERHGRNPSGASSGCSSGHESVSSSLTSGTQISSDSGTEVDQHPSSSGGVFEDPSPWNHLSLRQRNVSALRQSADQYVKMGKGSESVVRSTPNLTDLDGLNTSVSGGTYNCLGAWPSTGYISMPSSEEVRIKSGREGLYCKVGLDSLPAQRTLSLPQQQSQVSPVKGYVMFSSSQDSSPSGLHSQVQQPMSVSQSQPHGYVSHSIPWSNPLGSPKGSPHGKGYVMAGELDGYSSNKSMESPPLLIEMGDPGEDILDLEPIGETQSPESYSRFTLRPLHMSERTSNAEHVVSKPSSDFLNPSSGPRPPEVAGHDAASTGSHGHRTAETTAGYVPHRHFEKRENEPFCSSIFPDHREESYSLVSLNTSDTNVKSSLSE